MALINGNMDENYFRSIIKNMNYIYDDLFNKEDIELIEKNTFFDADEDDLPNELVSFGLKKSDAKNLDTTIWQNWNNNVSHTFENIYSKLICCLGKKSGTKKSLALVIPVYKDGKIELDKRTYSIESAKESCNFGGNNFYDDNATPEGYNLHCEALMNKYCLFLQKYDPENPLIDELCGCILGKKYISPALLEPANAAALGMVVGQRNCGIGQCIAPNAYKRQGDREQCASEINICSNNIDVSDISANSAEFKNITLNNDCGGNKIAAPPSNNVSIPEPEPSSEPESSSEPAAPSSEPSAPSSEPSAPSSEPAAPSSEPAAPSSEPAAPSSEPAAPSSAPAELGLWAKFVRWINSLFGIEGFSPKNNKFDQIYSVFSIIVIYMLIFKDPLKIQKKVQKMF